MIMAEAIEKCPHRNIMYKGSCRFETSGRGIMPVRQMIKNNVEVTTGYKINAS
jgi:hypothetical protein